MTLSLTAALAAKVEALAALLADCQTVTTVRVVSNALAAAQSELAQLKGTA